MPPDAFMFDTSGQLVMQTAIGGTGTLFGPLLGAAVWLFLRDFLQGALGLGAAWKLVLGLIFVMLVCFLRRGLIGGINDLYGYLTGKRNKPHEPDDIAVIDGAGEQPPRVLRLRQPSPPRWRRRLLRPPTASRA